MDEFETWELFEAQTSRRKPWETVADWRPAIVIEITEAELNDIIETAAREWARDHGYE
jgi:hypothetical protein